MRRPQGFDRPAAPAGGRAAWDDGVAEPASVAVAGHGDPRTDARDQQLTEPIDPLQTADLSGLIAPAAGVHEADEAPNGFDPRRRPGPRWAWPTLRRRAGDADGPPVAPSAAAEVRAARRALARAQRARRRYERQEVRRFTERARRRRRAWLIGVGSVLVVALGVLGAAYSPLMALRDVRVEGAARIPAAEIQAAFAEELGTPLPLVSSADVRTALQRFPLIETYSIETLPPGTLVVRIVERTPVGLLETPNGLELVDAAGVVIERPAAPPAGQPVISAGPVTSEGFRAAAGVVRTLPEEVRALVSRVTADTADDVRFELAGGGAVVWGSAEQSTLKATVLASLMRSAPPGAVSLYDVSAPMSPVTR